MLIVFQLLFIVFSFFAITRISKMKATHQLGPKGAGFWILFWIIADIAVLWPDSTTVVANLFGIGRGTDFVLYISFVVMFYLLFRLHVKVESIGRDITRVVRDKALEDVKSK